MLMYGEGRYRSNGWNPAIWFTTARPEEVRPLGIFSQGPKVYKDNSSIIHRKVDIGSFPPGQGFPVPGGPTSGDRDDKYGYWWTSRREPVWTQYARPAQTYHVVPCRPIHIAPNGSFREELTLLEVKYSLYDDYGKYKDKAYNVAEYLYVASITTFDGNKGILCVTISMAISERSWSSRYSIHGSFHPVTGDKWDLVSRLYAPDSSTWLSGKGINLYGDQDYTLNQLCEIARNYASETYYSGGDRRSSTKTISSFDADMSLERIRHFAETYKPPSYDLPVPNDVRWDAVTESAEGARILYINTMQYLKELPLLGRTIKTVLGIRKLNPKAMADAYLSAYYGLRLTIADSKEIARAARWQLSKESQRVSRIRSRKRYTRSDNVGVSYNLTIYYQQSDSLLIKALNTLQSIDLFPSLKNVWDIIPFSFVLDWFVNIQDVLEEIDAQTFWSTTSINAIIESEKSEMDVEVEGFGNVVFSDYIRRVQFSLPPCTPKLDDPTLPSLRNWVNGSFLVIQRR